MSSEDTIPLKYPYYWDAFNNGNEKLAEYLLKHKPSMVQNDGSKPWIWVRGSASSTKDVVEGEAKAVEEAQILLKGMTQKIENVKSDPNIPQRSSKKTGARSKKEVREEIQADAAEKLKDISTKHGYVNGKMLVFAPPEKVDAIWSTISNSLVSGPLSSTAAYLAKVATSPQQTEAHYQHVICVYMPDVYDQESVKQVLTVLLRDHGITPNGTKSDLYTLIGLDSKHPSQIQSTVWKNSSLIPEPDIKERALRDSFWEKFNADKDAQKAEKKAEKEAKGDSKLKPKKKPKGNDPFGSSDEEDNEVKTNANKRNKGEEEEGRPKKKKRI